MTTGDVPVSVEIADVVPAAVRVLPGEIRPGDRVFDVFGGMHVVTRVRSFGHTVRVDRADGWPAYFAAELTCTIVRGEVSD